jgi:hypothetical protein
MEPQESLLCSEQLYELLNAVMRATCLSHHPP